MMKKLHNLISIFILVLTFFCQFSQHAKAFDSMLEFESRSHKGGNAGSGIGYLKSLDNCFTTGKVMYPWEYADFNNTCIPFMLSKTHNSCSGGTSGLALLTNIGRGAVYFTMLMNFPIGSLVALLAIGVEYIIMVDLCTNAFIVKPSEYINLNPSASMTDGPYMTCESNGAEILNNAPNKLTDVDVPFYYHCDPYYDPLSSTPLVAGVVTDEPLIGKTWGYMGAASPFCAGTAENYARKDMIGKVVVHYVSGWSRFWSGLNSKCNQGGSGSPKRHELILKAGEKKYLSPAHFLAYYRFSSTIGKVQLCVATPFTLLPIRIGCSYVPPPSDDLDLDAFLKAYLQDTRCYYFVTGRTDLFALGKNLNVLDGANKNKHYIKEFLSSDMHVISTIVGCMQDMLVKVFINPDSLNLNGSKPFFQVIQERLKQIVYVALILYVSLVGIKIMIASEVPNRGELIMYLLKFGLVLYFATGDAWYSTDHGKRAGLYPSLIAASSEIAGFFMSAQNDNDPIGFCQYQFNGTNLLQENEIRLEAVAASGAAMNTTSPALEATYGFKNVIKITTWDLMDCKLLNYLNLGSCKYTVAGLIGVWIISAAFFAGLVGFLLSIVSFIYCLMLLLIVFKFVHIFILSMFVLTILILVSPLILCFALFEFTKGIFQQWMKMVLGYMLYPALLFAFIALMLATFDSVFYGDIDLAKHNGDIVKACQDVDSVYCTTLGTINDDPCGANIGNLNSTLTTTLNLGPFGKFTILKDIYVKPYFDAVLKLMLFAFLFYLFIDSVSSFLAILTGVQDLGGMAKGSINIGSMMISLGSAAFSGSDKKKDGGDDKKKDGDDKGSQPRDDPGGVTGGSGSSSASSSAASGAA